MTAVIVSTGGKACGVIAMQDQQRLEARAVIVKLHERGIRTVTRWSQSHHRRGSRATPGGQRRK